MKRWMLVFLACAVAALVYLRGLSRPAIATAPAATAPAAEPGDDSPSGEPRALDGVAELATRAELEEARAELAARVDELAGSEATDELVIALARLATVQRRLGDEDAALSTAERAVELAPEDGLAHFVHAKALARKLQTGGMMYALRNLGTYKDALARAIELDPSNVAARVEQAAFYVIAPSIAGGDVEVGRALADALEPADPTAADWIRVTALRKEERFDAAEELCRRALDAEPDDQELRAALAGVLVETERLDEAVPEYERVLAGRHGPTYYRTLYEYGRALAEAEREPERVLELFREYASDVPLGMDLAPPVAGAHWRSGQALERLGRADEARAAYEAALEEDPELEEAVRALAELDSDE